MFKDQSLARNLFAMTWPMLLGAFALMSFQLVDSFFISLLGTEPLAAMGFTMPLNQLMVGIQVGVGIAATALISKAIGAKRQQYAKQLSALVLLVGGISMAILMLIIWATKTPVLHALGAEDNLFPYTDSYWLPWLLSSWAHAFVYFGTSISRAHGDTKLPGLIMVAASLLNMALDPIFIFVFGWGLPGAAYATIVACIITGGVLFLHLTRRQWLRFCFADISIIKALRSIANISLPAMLSQLMPGMAALLATRIVATFGSAAIAAWALGSRLEMFSIVMVLALTMSMPPMLGHLLGANKLDQAHDLIRLATRFILLSQVVIAAMWLLFRPWMVATLTQDVDTADYLASYMLWVPISYAPIGVCILMVSASNALGMPMRAVVISICRLFVFYLPCIALGAYLADMEGIYYGVLVGNIAAGINSWLFYRRGYQGLQRQINKASTA